MPESLQSRYHEMNRTMVDQFERIAAIENHWLIYTLVGWEHMVTSLVCHLMVERGIQLRWPYVLTYLVQIAVLFATTKLVSGPPRLKASPVEDLNKRVWTVYIFLCINVAVLNVVAGHEIFVFMPALAALSSFAFSVLSTFFSRKFIAAGLSMFLTGILMARYQQYMFLIYGAGWLAVLQTIGIVFLRKRSRWLATIPVASVVEA